MGKHSSRTRNLGHLEALKGSRRMFLLFFLLSSLIYIFLICGKNIALKKRCRCSLCI
nr:hypothetical protein [Marseillevirus cajuinensis]